MMIIDYVFLGLYSDLVVPLSLSLRTVRKGGEVSNEYAIRVSAKIWSTNGDGVVHPAEQICKVVFECLSKAICVTVEYLYVLGMRLCYNLRSALADSRTAILLAVDCCDCY